LKAVTSQRKAARLRDRRDAVRFEVSTAMTVKNAVFWDIKTQFVLHR
jgi:hypothetical protein